MVMAPFQVQVGVQGEATPVSILGKHLRGCSFFTNMKALAARALI